MHITQVQAEQFLRTDLAGAEASVNHEVGPAPTAGLTRRCTAEKTLYLTR